MKNKHVYISVGAIGGGLLLVGLTLSCCFLGLGFGMLNSHPRPPRVATLQERIQARQPVTAEEIELAIRGKNTWQIEAILGRPSSTGPFDHRVCWIYDNLPPGKSTVLYIDRRTGILDAMISR